MGPLKHSVILFRIDNIFWPYSVLYPFNAHGCYRWTSWWTCAPSRSRHGKRPEVLWPEVVTALKTYCLFHKGRSSWFGKPHRKEYISEKQCSTDTNIEHFIWECSLTCVQSSTLLTVPQSYFFLQAPRSVKSGARSIFGEERAPKRLERRLSCKIAWAWSSVRRRRVRIGVQKVGSDIVSTLSAIQRQKRWILSWPWREN